MDQPYKAVVLVSFGGPEKPEDVLPFLDNVFRDKRIPRHRVLEVVKTYDSFGGVSPINGQNRALLAALLGELNQHGPHLPVYWGNRNWHPLLTDTFRQMAQDGIQRALALVTSAFGSYSGCRQYLEDIQRARQEVGPEAPVVDKLRLFYNHPGFVEAMADRVRAALEEIPPPERDAARIVYTAHSIPRAMAERCEYVRQLNEACRLVSELLQRTEWHLVYQSRSGRPSEPWLGPDVGDYLLQANKSAGVDDLVIVPIGFLCEHMEVINDLDVQIGGLCRQLGIRMVRAGVVGTHPRFVTMIRELIQERIDEAPTRLALGSLGPSHDVCPADCCCRE